jgi:threonyl-tRNA synthetase
VARARTGPHLPVSDDNLGYAKQLQNRYLGDFRVDIEDRSWTVGKKIQQTHDDNVPYTLIVGDNEEAGTVSVRDRQECDDVSVEAFRDHLEAEVESKATDPTFLE